MLSRYVLVCASAFLVTIASATAGRGADGERLNVVLILADDKY